MSTDDDMPSAAQVQAAESGRATHPQEPHSGGTAGRLNWLRAAVLGANDGIVSVAGIVIGVAGATTNRGPIFTAGLAGLVAGAVSMALGEYVSVSSQRDSERAQIKQEKRELATSPEAELTELTALYEAKGLSAATAHTVAVELSARGALAAHLDAELHIDPADIPSPVQAAGASALSFTSGAGLPMLAILLPPAGLRVPVTFVAVLIALGLTGALSARLGGSDVRRAVLRVVIGGALGLAFTSGVGHLFGTAIGEVRWERADLDCAVPGGGVGARDLDGLAQVRAVDDVEAGDLLLRLGERAVGEEDLTIARAYRRGVL